VNALGIANQLVEIGVAIAVAPLLTGWVSQCRAWLSNRSGPGVLQPYRMLRKLLAKDAVVAHGASPLFRFVPYLQFAAMGLAAAIIPSLSTEMPFSRAARCWSASWPSRRC
jgi:formate hydrogenlyase subunit 4